MRTAFLSAETGDVCADAWEGLAAGDACGKWLDRKRNRPIDSGIKQVGGVMTRRKQEANGLTGAVSIAATRPGSADGTGAERPHFVITSLNRSHGSLPSRG
jgi:hypothetical protein